MTSDLTLCWIFWKITVKPFLVALPDKQDGVFEGIMYNYSFAHILWLCDNVIILVNSLTG